LRCLLENKKIKQKWISNNNRSATPRTIFDGYSPSLSTMDNHNNITAAGAKRGNGWREELRNHPEGR